MTSLPELGGGGMITGLLNATPPQPPVVAMLCFSALSAFIITASSLGDKNPTIDVDKSMLLLGSSILRCDEDTQTLWLRTTESRGRVDKQEASCFPPQLVDRQTSVW